MGHLYHGYVSHNQRVYLILGEQDKHFKLECKASGHGHPMELQPRGVPLQGYAVGQWLRPNKKNNPWRNGDASRRFNICHIRLGCFQCVLPTKVKDEPPSSWPWEVAMTVQKTHPSLMSTRSMAPYLAWWTMGLTLPWSNMTGKYNILYD